MQRGIAVKKVLKSISAQVKMFTKNYYTLFIMPERIYRQRQQNVGVFKVRGLTLFKEFLALFLRQSRIPITAPQADME